MRTLESRLNGSHIVLNLSKNISSSITTILLGGTVNDGLAYVFMGRNLLHGNRCRDIVHSCRYLKLGIIKISTHREFFSTLRKVDSPRRGQGVVKTGFVRIFRSRNHAVSKMR